MEDKLRDIVQLSLSSEPEEMLKKSLETCIELAGATGGSILGEEGPYLQFLFSDVKDLIGMRVPFDSIAGVTVNRSMVVYTYAPEDKRHFTGIDDRVGRVTRYLLSIPIPSIHRAKGADQQARNAGALQLLFRENLFPETDVTGGHAEFPVDEFRESRLYQGKLRDVFWILPIVAFGLEVIQLRQTSYQAIHELKNKMIAALSWLNYLKNDVQRGAAGILNDENVANDFALVESSVREGADLAKSYLQFTRIYNPNFSPVNINDVLRDIARSAEALAAEMKAPGLEVKLALDDAIAPRNLDAGQLKMAFFNLCKNAVEALIKSETPAPALTIASSRSDGKIAVVVGDNGPGMPAEIADNLFVPFKTKKEGGTGLGLAITKKIVDIHGGTIRCETGGSGTRFVIAI